MFVLLDQYTLQCLDSALVYDQNIYQLHAEVKEIEDNHTNRQ